MAASSRGLRLLSRRSLALTRPGFVPYSPSSRPQRPGPLPINRNFAATTTRSEDDPAPASASKTSASKTSASTGQDQNQQASLPEFTELGSIDHDQPSTPEIDQGLDNLISEDIFDEDVSEDDDEEEEVKLYTPHDMVDEYNDMFEDEDGHDRLEIPYRMPQERMTQDEIEDETLHEPFAGDDISSTAHGELQQLREIREFNRVAAWDMPLLWNHRKPFNPPDEKQTPLRWRYTTYMGETHDGASKVVVDFSPSAVAELSEAQISKMIKLLGPRFDPLTQRAKISSNRYPTVAQNKRYLGDMVEKLIKETKEGKDMFEDVPFDFRASKHVEKRRKYRLLRKGFPEEWKMTQGRREELERKRAQALNQEQQRVLSGRLVDGVALLQEGAGGPVVAEQRQPEMARVRR